MTRAFETTDFRVPAYIDAEADDAVSSHPSDLTSVGMPALIAHLADYGHRRLAHIAGPATWSAARNRVVAFEAAVADQGLESAGVLHGDWSAGSGYDAIAGLAHLPDATAFVAANDQMALGAMLALKERGLRVPDDVSVVGIDDIPESAYFDPPLTTLHIDFEAAGRLSVHKLLARIERTEMRPGGGAAARAGRPQVVGSRAGPIVRRVRPRRPERLARQFSSSSIHSIRVSSQLRM